MATPPQPSRGPKNGRIGYITPAFSGVPNSREKIRSGYITPAFLGADSLVGGGGGGRKQARMGNGRATNQHITKQVWWTREIVQTCRTNPLRKRTNDVQDFPQNLFIRIGTVQTPEQAFHKCLSFHVGSEAGAFVFTSASLRETTLLRGAESWPKPGVKILVCKGGWV